MAEANRLRVLRAQNEAVINLLRKKLQAMRRKYDIRPKEDRSATLRA